MFGHQYMAMAWLFSHVKNMETGSVAKQVRSKRLFEGLGVAYMKNE